MRVPTNPSVRVQTVGRAYEAGRVAPQGNPNAEPTRQLGEAIEAAGQTVLRVDDILQERVDRAKAREADGKLSDMTRRFLSSPEGYLHTEGRAAVDGRKELLERLNQERQSLLSTLSDRQRELVSESDETRYQHTLNAIDGHYAKQVDAYDLAERDARANALAKDAVDSYFNPVNPASVAPAQDPQAPQGPTQVKRAGFQDNRIAALAEVEALARRRGLGPEATKSALQKFDDQIHGTIISLLVDKGRALEAADYLSKHKDQMSLSARTRVEKSVQDGGVKEQGQVIASWLRPQGTTIEQVAVLDELHKQGGISIEVRDEAERRLIHNANLKNAHNATEGLKALEEAQTWAQLPENRFKSISVDTRERLRSFGREAAFDLWTAQGGQFITTNAGLQRTLRMSDTQLGTDYASADALIRDFETDLSPDDMGKLVLRWRKARGELLTPAETEKMDRTEAIKGFLFGKGFYSRFVESDDKFSAMRVNAFEAAIVARVNQHKETRAEAMEKVYADGFTVDDKWIPAVMATPEEQQKAVVKLSSGRTLTPEVLGNPTTVRTTVTRVDGGQTDLRPSANADTLPTRNQIIDDFRAVYKRNPTETEIGEHYEMEVLDIEQRARDTQRLAVIENKERARVLLEGLAAEVNHTFAKRRIGPLGSLIRTRTPSGETRYVTSADAAGVSPKEDFRASLEIVLAKHADALNRYGLTRAMAAQWVPDAKKMLPEGDPLLRPIVPLPARAGVPSIFNFRAPLPGEVFDPGPTAQEAAEAAELRKKYQKTEPTK